MNLKTDLITIRDNKVISDNRDGVNNVETVSSIKDVHKQQACIFTDKNKDGVRLNIKVDNGQLIRLSLDREQLLHLNNLIEPYLG